jgi:hypothetical protein
VIVDKTSPTTFKQGGDNPKVLSWSLVRRGIEIFDLNTWRDGDIGEPIAKPACTEILCSLLFKCASSTKLLFSCSHFYSLVLVEETTIKASTVRHGWDLDITESKDPLAGFCAYFVCCFCCTSLLNQLRHT